MATATNVSDDGSGCEPAGAGTDDRSLRAELVRCHARVIWAVCLANARRAQDAEDLMQETFVKAFAALESLREPERARPWLLQIARRLCVDHLRQKRPAGELPEGLPARSDTLDPRIDRLHAALRKLPEDYRETISLYYLDGRDCSGVAATLGISPGAVRTRLLRGRVMLYDLLQEDEPC